MKKAFLIFLIAFVSPVFAFSKDKCSTLFPKSDDSHPPYYSPFYVSTMVPSTTSYFSSFGACAMYGAYDVHPRDTFIANAAAPLRQDAARGRGEYVDTLAELSGCPASHYGAFAKALHRKFVAGTLPVEGAPLAAEVDAAIQSSRELKAACTLL